MTMRPMHLELPRVLCPLQRGEVNHSSGGVRGRAAPGHDVVVPSHGA